MRQLFLTVLVALAIAIAGVPDAFAKAGSGSLGSRGSRTYDRPMQRSVTPPPPAAAPRPGAVESAPLSPQAAPMYRPNQASPLAAPAAPGFFQRNPFMAGLAGGLVGAGIGSMLFGHSPALAAASEGAPAASLLGLLLQLALIGGLVWLAVRFFRGRSSAVPAPNPYARASHEHMEPMLASHPTAPRIEKEFEAAPADQQAFSEILLGVQKAWSDGDLAAMKRWATPEVVSFMSEDLSNNASRGLANKVENVSLLKGDVTESWRENGRDYVTAVITFGCLDYMVRADTGALADGDPRTPVQHTEAWTFMRSANGRWLLSAVEEV
jgi:predicted lipid-binding transport protein (Tim44 family)